MLTIILELRTEAHAQRTLMPPGGSALDAQRFVVDGELVIPRGETSSFQALQMRLHPAASRIARLAAATPATLVLFDMPFDVGGGSQMQRPLRERRAALELFFASLDRTRARRFILTPYTRSVDEAEGWLARAGGALDGVVAKRLGRWPVSARHAASAVAAGQGAAAVHRRAIGPGSAAEPALH